MEHLQGQAGSHDIDRVLILPENAGSLLVTRHEGVHDKLLTETPFGTIQFAFRQLQKNAISPVTRSNAERWLEELFDASMLTHECGATYLSIKSFPVEMHSRLLSGHSKEYERYFHYPGDVIDPVFHSSYLQFLVGKIAVEVCLSSRLQEHLCDWSLDLKVEIADCDAPDNRLKELLPTIGNKLCRLVSFIDENIAREKNTLSLPRRFDFQSEDAWSSLTVDIGDKLDNYLLSIIREWMYPIAEKLWPCLLHEEWMDCRKRFVHNIETRSGTNLFSSFFTHFTHQRPSLSVVTIRRALRHGVTVIDNKRIADQVQLRHLDNSTEPIAILTDPPGPRIFITDSLVDKSLENLCWNRLVYLKKDQLFHADKLSHKLMKKALQVRKTLAATGLPIPNIDLIVVGLRWNPTSVFDSLYTEIVAYHTIEHSNRQMYFDVDRIIWYMGGDFFGWYDMLVSLGTLETVTLHTREKVSEDQFSKLISRKSTLQEIDYMTKIESKSPDWLVFRNPSLAGLFLRILPVESAGNIYAILAHDLKKDYLKIIPDQEKEHIANLVSKARTPIMLSWEEI